MPGVPEAGKGRCCHPADISGSCSWATGASWHPAFVRPGRRKGQGPAAIQTARFQEATGHRAFSLTPLLEGRKTGKKEKSPHLQRGKSSSASFTTEVCQSKRRREVKPHQSPRPSLTSLQEQRRRVGTRGTATHPQGRRCECILATASPRDGLPRLLQGRKGKKPTYRDGLYLGSDTPTPGPGSRENHPV